MQKKLSNDSPYAPAEDTYFLEDNLVNEKGKNALDIGTGSGYLTRTLSQNFSQVIGTDIDFNSLINQSKKIKSSKRLEELSPEEIIDVAKKTLK